MDETNNSANLTGDKYAETQTKKLGNSDMSITPVGFGAWAIGGRLDALKMQVQMRTMAEALA